MYFSKLIIILCFIFFLETWTVFGADPLFYICSNSQNFTSYSPYETNLKKVLGSLSLNTPPTGFGISSSSSSNNIGTYQVDQAAVYGLSLCRGDVASNDCKSCVVDAVSEIHSRCRNNKGGVIWYDNCLLKYSNEDFYGKIDNQNKFYMWNLRNVNSSSSSFNMETRNLLSQLANRAYVDKKMYAVGEAVMKESGNNNNKLYGLVQCTRDLSSADCKKCLDGAVNELPSCCDGKEGGRVVGESCNIRYEIYPFVNAN